MNDALPEELENVKSPEQVLMLLSFYFSLLTEYQLIDLQANVREFVFAMSSAIQEMDQLVVAEGRMAQSLYESLFNQKTSDDLGASNINRSANNRVEHIFLEALKKLHPGQSPVANFNSDPNFDKEEVEVANISNPSSVPEPIDLNNKIWSDIAKRFESFCRLEERLRPQIYIMVQSLNFEDIQTQRLEHALAAQKRLNEGIIRFLKKGIQNITLEETKDFARDLIAKTKASYTMVEERKVFEQVFIKDDRFKK